MKKGLSRLIEMMNEVPPIILTFLVLSVVGMNILANKSINTGLDWLALDCGILLSWLTFLSLDVLTHCFGPRTATAMSMVAIVVNLFMALVFFVASCISGVWGESFVEGSEAIINQALDNTIGGTWFIILGSSIAFATSAVVNNFMNWFIGERLAKRGGFGVFALLVSQTFFGWSLVQCVTCAITGAVLELVFEVFFSPIGYRIALTIAPDRVGSQVEKVA